MTRLQIWQRAVLDALADARAELDPATYEVLLDIVCARIASDYIRLLLNDKRDEEAA